MDTHPCTRIAATESAEINRYAALAALPPEQMLDLNGLAACLNRSTRSVQRWVHANQLPPPARMGNKDFWFVGRIREWLDRRCKDAEAKASREAARLGNYEFRT
jgi:predicted DNA-binding transcriptional regulator AlpA